MTRIVSEEKILSPYSYLLFYKRREFSSSAIINLTFKSFDKNSKWNFLEEFIKLILFIYQFIYSKFISHTSIIKNKMIKIEMQ